MVLTFPTVIVKYDLQLLFLYYWRR